MADDDTPVATAGPPPTVDAQDPLPESNWFWRRTFIFGLTAILIGGCAWVIWPLRVMSYQGNETALKGLIDLPFYMLGLILVNQIFYTIAPSGEQVAKMFNLSSILTRGAGWMSTATASAPGGGQVTTQTKVVGAPPSSVSSPGGGNGGTSLNVGAGPVNADTAKLPWNKGSPS